MRTLLRAAVLALPLLATPSALQAWCFPPVKVDCGANFHLNGYVGNCGFGAQAGPWYTYFPYNAYFQTPAPVHGWPFWPAPAGPESVPPVMPNLPSQLPAAQGVRPAGYAAPPSYWYQR
jgi:hypothetical protein